MKPEVGGFESPLAFFHPEAVRSVPVSCKNFKLGKAAPRHDARTLQLAKYLALPGLPPSPVAKSWLTASRIRAWTMMLNDRLGDCVIASKGHLIQLMTALTPPHRTVVLPDEAILRGYEDVGGYVPGDEETDQGCNMLDALNYMRKTGLGGHTFEAFASVRPSDRHHVQAAVNLFAGLDVGLALPVTAQAQTDAGATWDVAGDGRTGAARPASWGLHCAPVFDYDPEGPTCVTWARKQKMTWKFFFAYCDEAYAVLSRDWIAGNRAPNLFDYQGLRDDLLLVAD